MVFSKSYCPYCTKAKDVLKKYNLSADDYEVMEIDNDPNAEEIQDYLRSLTGARSVSTCTIAPHRVGYVMFFTNNPRIAPQCDV